MIMPRGVFSGHAWVCRGGFKYFERGVLKRPIFNSVKHYCSFRAIILYFSQSNVTLHVTMVLVLVTRHVFVGMMVTLAVIPVIIIVLLLHRKHAGMFNFNNIHDCI